jgi:hypothetical protein
VCGGAATFGLVVLATLAAFDNFFALSGELAT